MREFLLIATLLLTHSSLSAGIFSWTDASGNVVYGDSPPKNAAAKAVAPPKLTILENFANRYEDQNASSRRASAKSSGISGSNRSAARPRKVALEQPYKVVKIIAPKAQQQIRANDGDVSIALSTSPKLRASDKVVIHLDGQKHLVTKSRVANLSNLDRGEHKLLIEIQNAAGESLISSAEINFNVLRNSVLTNKKKPYNPYDDDPSQ